ncbi:spindle and kinetochore-associated protein 3 [Alligator sinensis]|uniref:Spindle and kinetochore-associated protein 3 n=1 Tax=Alligator sinensis TaxID=38654 RepID=A0A1U7RNX1_ALLSI|nr:spindle and kinetochore-associated protein 3 [Alligator sinensis]
MKRILAEIRNCGGSGARAVLNSVRSVSGSFFSGLRQLAVTLERETRQLERALNREERDYEDEPPMRVLHDLHCEVRTLKGDVRATLDKSCCKREEMYDFIKASKVLMQRNASDLEKIRELFQKYGYKPLVRDNSVKEEDKEVNHESKVSDQNNSDQEENKPAIPACIEKPPAPQDPLRSPHLSDFGLSQYAFSRTWNAMNIQPQINMHKEDSRNNTTLAPEQMPYMPPITPKCTLKMDDCEHLTPKLEHFGISEHTMCLNEDYTMTLINKSLQANKMVPKYNNNEVIAVTSRSNKFMVSPGPTVKMPTKNALDYMASPLVPTFCTPGLKIPSKRDAIALSKSPDSKESITSNDSLVPTHPDFQTFWLKTETKQLKERNKAESVGENGMTNIPPTENCVPSNLSSDEYLEHLGEPSPPKISSYESLPNTPPPPEITQIPEDILQILSKYNPKINAPTAKKMETKPGITTRFGSNTKVYCNKENKF